jgi:hypothetical protein
MALVVPVTASTSWVPVNDGRAERSSASWPATSGAENDVPSSLV